MNKTIKQLRQTGYKVRVMHTRKHNLLRAIDGSFYKQMSNFGGYTRIELTTPCGSVTVAGESTCSDKDNFNRRLGNSIALGRALENLRVCASDISNKK